MDELIKISIAVPKNGYKDAKNNKIIKKQILDWSMNAFGEELNPSDVYVDIDIEGKIRKPPGTWLTITAVWIPNENQLKHYKKYCAELDAQKNKPLTIKRK